VWQAFVDAPYRVRRCFVHGGEDDAPPPTIGAVTEPDPRLDPAVQEAAGAREAVRATYRAAEAFVERLPPRAAYSAATALAEILRDLAERAAGLRARMVARVARVEGLSVRATAAALGLSKSKAGDLRARGARTRDRPDPGEGAGRSAGRG
jgi:hypothetical protein